MSLMSCGNLIYFGLLLLIKVNFCENTEIDDGTFETFLDMDDIDLEYNENARNAMKPSSLKWPNGIIPYVISDKFSETERTRIVDALKMFPEKTCIQVIPKEAKHTDYVYYDKGKGCGTLVGYNRLKSKPHKVQFNDYCITLPEAIQHETMHVMGIFHEQCRWDRDEYIEVMWKNIEPSQKRNFIKIPKPVADSYGVEYDYNSLMHYGSTAFRRKGTNETMRMRSEKIQGKTGMKLGQQGHASEGDILKMNRMYGCK